MGRNMAQSETAALELIDEPEIHFTGICGEAPYESSCV